MKKALYIFLLITRVCIAQTYEFQTIDKRNIAEGWEIRPITGVITIAKDSIVITTPYNTQVLQITSQQQFVRHDDKIFSCINEIGAKVNLRLYCKDIDRRKFELYYYSNEIDNKYFRFCLVKS